VKTTFVGHACLRVDCGDVTILSDPWWQGPCFGAQWWAFPKPRPDLARGDGRRFVYISHGHHDHLHPASLKSLGSGHEVLVAAGLGIDRTLRELGCAVREVAADELVDLGGARLRIWPTHGDDSLLVIDDGTRISVNANDALHAAPDSVIEEVTARLKSLYPRIDDFWCGFGTASHFPNCYGIPGKDRLATARARQRFFNERWARIVVRLAPRFAFPFAADVVLLEDDLIWANAAIHDSERPVETCARLHPRAAATRLIDPAPGFAMDGDTIVAEELRRPATEEDIRAAMAAERARANDYGQVPPEMVAELLQLMRTRLDASGAHFASFDGDYTIAFRLRALEAGLLLRKQGRRLSVEAAESIDALPEADLTVISRAHYLRAALAQAGGDEILFVGSGIRFEYRDPAQAKRDLHREVMALLRPLPAAGLQRERSGFGQRARNAVKKLVGRHSPDLYSLGAWTVYAR